MNILLQIKAQLDRANDNVAELERAAVEYPSLPSIAANLASAVRIQKKLQAQFAEATARVDVENEPSTINTP